MKSLTPIQLDDVLNQHAQDIPDNNVRKSYHTEWRAKEDDNFLHVDQMLPGEGVPNAEQSC